MEVFESIKPVIPPNLGWLDCKVSDDIMHKMSETIRMGEEKNISASERLAGHLFKEFSILEDANWFIQEVIAPLIDSYEYNFKSLSGDMMTKNHRYTALDLWVNYQRKGDFNPIHYHSGAYSFVLFFNIPTNWETENQEVLNVKKEPCISDFSFVYSDLLGEIKQEYFHLNESDNGRLIFFPAKLRHLVNPFYKSDDLRITISGNIGLNSDLVIEPL